MSELIAQEVAEVSAPISSNIRVSQEVAEVSAPISSRRARLSTFVVEVACKIEPIPDFPPETEPLNESSIVLSIGSVSGYRWRGPRQSSPLITHLESVLQDITSLSREARLCNPNPPTELLISQEGTVPGIYGLGGADPRNNVYAEGLSSLGPLVFELNMIRIESLRTQVNYLIGMN